MAEKLQYQTPFQEAILRYTLNDRDGLKVLDYIKENSFALIEHSVIFYTIEKVYGKHHRITSYPIMAEALEKVFLEREFDQALSEDDRKEIRELLQNLYEVPVKDGDLLLEEVARFGSYVELKDTLERVDLTDYESYENFASAVQRAIGIADTKKETQGTFLIKGIKDRQMRRQIEDTVIPTPWRQVNKLTSAGGYGKGSIIVIIDRPKNLKTFALMNWARGYMRQKKKVLVIDLENGEDNLAMRLEQSIAKVDKKTLLKGDHDKVIQKVLRRYNRMGGEVYIKRLPAYSTTAHIQRVIDEVYREYGIKFDVLIVDYIALMGSMGKTKTTEETTRIGESYVDVANLALKNDFQHVVTAMHIVRGAIVRSETRYSENDIAKSIDIIRHAHAIYGLNRSEEEKEAGIMRMELVVQRDGAPTGRAYFSADAATQRMDELTKKQIAEVERIMNEAEESEESRNGNVSKTGDL